MKVAEYIFSFFEKKKVEKAFFLSGGGCMHLIDALARSSIEGVALLHEQAVGIACEGYANTKKDVGFAIVTSGPGATNILTPLLAAYIDSSPCIFITGQMKTADLRENYNVRALGSQEADIVAMAKASCKFAVQIRDKNNIKYYLEKAYYLATSGRKGPVLLDIPLDIQGAELDITDLISFNPEELMENEQIDNQVSIDSIIDALKNAKRPIIIAGNGVSSNIDSFFECIEFLNIPVISTWKAKDILYSKHPLFIGHAGGMGDRHANLAMQNADFILSLGSRLDFSITGYDRTKWATKAKKIIIDVDKTELDKLHSVTNLIPLHSNVFDSIKKILEEKSKMVLNDITDWKNTIANWKNKYSYNTQAIQAEDNKEQENSLSTYDFVRCLSALLPEDACIAPCSAGTTAEIFFQAFETKKGQIIRSNHGLGSMGFDIPNAIGMCCAINSSSCKTDGKENKNVYCIAGDGGMQLNIQELAIIKGRELPIKLFVINNRGYASIRNMQKGLYEKRFLGCDCESGTFLPKLERIAHAYELAYFSISSIEELSATIEKAISFEGPLIIEIFAEENCVVSPRSVTQVMPDGSMQSSPLENQFPFLSDDEMKENMLH